MIFVNTFIPRSNQFDKTRILILMNNCLAGCGSTTLKLCFECCICKIGLISVFDDRSNIYFINEKKFAKMYSGALPFLNRNTLSVLAGEFTLK